MSNLKFEYQVRLAELDSSMDRDTFAKNFGEALTKYGQEGMRFSHMQPLGKFSGVSGGQIEHVERFLLFFEKVTYEKDGIKENISDLQIWNIR